MGTRRPKWLTVKASLSLPCPTQKNGEPEGSPSTTSQIDKGEVELQPKLDVAPLGRLRAVRNTLLGTNGRHACTLLDVEVSSRDVVVAVVEGVVELAAELHVEPLRQ